LKILLNFLILIKIIKKNNSIELIKKNNLKTLKDWNDFDFEKKEDFPFGLAILLDKFIKTISLEIVSFKKEEKINEITTIKIINSEENKKKC